MTKLLASGFGIGFIPGPTGSYATAVSAVIWWYLFPADWIIYSIIIIAGFVVSVIVAGRAEKLFGTPDDKRIVIDEIIGFWFAVAYLRKSLPFAIAGLVFFRFFDVAKIPSIRKLEKLPGGFGVVMDDVAAGIITNLLVRFISLVVGYS
ncbi:MAG: phosphatidylglycerophosphatase A [Elusimicrobiota bacterium]